MAVLFARLREIALPILREGGDSDARGTRLPAAGPVAWTHSGRRVRLIHNPGSQNRRLHAESGGADADGIGGRALPLLRAPRRYRQALLLARQKEGRPAPPRSCGGDRRTSGSAAPGGGAWALSCQPPPRSR